MVNRLIFKRQSPAIFVSFPFGQGSNFQLTVELQNQIALVEADSSFQEIGLAVDLQCFQVMRVQHRISRKYFAVKLVSSDCGSVNNELSILSRVSHPFVIRLEEVRSM